jgi:hypothetical protein
MPDMFWLMPGGEAVMTMTRLQAGAFKAMLKWQVESLGFLRHRCEQDIRLIDDLLQSPEPGEVLSTCSCYFQGALDDYSKEAVKAASYGSKVATDTAREFRSGAERLSENAMAATIA